MKTEEIIKRAFDPYFPVPLEAWKSFIDLGKMIVTTKDQILKNNELNVWWKSLLTSTI